MSLVVLVITMITFYMDVIQSLTHVALITMSMIHTIDDVWESHSDVNLAISILITQTAVFMLALAFADLTFITRLFMVVACLITDIAMLVSHGVSFTDDVCQEWEGIVESIAIGIHMVDTVVPDIHVDVDLDTDIIITVNVSAQEDIVLHVDVVTIEEVLDNVSVTEELLVEIIESEDQ